MGTNYYTFTKPCPKACDHCGLATEVHLGKSSGGWRFIFNLNGRRHYTDIRTMKAFLVGKVIKDEYGRLTTHREFWEMVERKQHEKSQANDAEGGVIPIGAYDFLDSDFS